MTMLRSLPLSFLFLFVTPVPLLAQSITPAADGTGTQVLQEGDSFQDGIAERYTITGGSRSRSNLFHSFERLGLNADEIATFLSQPDIENILGRVTGGDTSLIDGLLQVTGGNSNLYLMNPAGIVFGPNARLDLSGSFFATTATGIGFGENWFHAVGDNTYAELVGNPDSFAFSLAEGGAIANLANLTVNPGESITLLGGTVTHAGTLTAPGGTITLAAVPGGNRVRLEQTGSLLSLELEAANGIWNTALNPISITPLSLPELLTGGNLNQVSQLTVNPDGTIRLSGANVPMQDGTTLVSGTVDAAGMDGEINVLGDRVALLNANLNTAGTNDGGDIRIGGDYQGQGSVFNASRTFVSQDSIIAADALESGHGGRAIVWADDTTQFLGAISVQGGAIAGNGGFVEVSGAQNLLFDGTVDLAAPAGVAGQLLLDPTNVTIDLFGANDTELVDGNIFATDPGGTFSISAARVVNSLTTGNVLIEATNTIDVNSDINSASANGLTLTAAAININADITLSGGNLDLRATAGEVNIAALPGGIATQGGNITVTSTSPTAFGIVTGAPINSGGGTITLTGGSTGASVGPVPPRGVSIQNTIASNGGSITINGSSTQGIGVATSATINAGTGDINITGRSDGPGTFGRGISLLGDLTSNGGTITLEGTSAQENGIATLNPINAGSGNVILTGVSRGTGTSARGIDIGAPVTTTGGTLTLNGSGEGGGIVSSSSSTGSFNAGSGNITFNSSSNNISDTSAINANTLTLSGGGSFSLNNSSNDVNTIVATSIQNLTFADRDEVNLGTLNISGNLTISSSGSITDSGAVTVRGTTFFNSGTSNIQLDTGANDFGIIRITNARDAIITDANSLQIEAIATGNINVTVADTLSIIGNFQGPNTTLTANEINIADSANVTGTGTLTLQPSRTGQAIALGGTTDRGAGTLDLLSSDLNRISAARPLVIGRSDGTSTLTIVNTGALNTSLTTLRGVTTLASGDTGFYRWDITGANAGTVDGLSFTGIPNLLGGNGNDTVVLASGARISGSISGGGGDNTLISTSNTNSWVINGSNSGSLNGSAFTGFQDLLGSSGADTIRVETDTPFAGNFQGLGSDLMITGNTVNFTGTIVSSGGNISIEATENINVGIIRTTTPLSSSTGEFSGEGGSLRLTAQNGAVSTGELSTAGTRGGSLTINAATAITTGRIATFGSTGDGGNVLLDPVGDIEVRYINAEGGSSGIGGTVDITAGRFFRATDSFINRDGEETSISTAGGLGGGPITIRHGGNGDTPFVLGPDFGDNGSQGAITDGMDSFAIGESIPENATRGNVRIVTRGDGAGAGGDNCDRPGECDDYDLEEDDLDVETEEDLEFSDVTNTQETLLALAEQTGIPPAVIYVSFVSPEITLPNDIAQREAIASQQITNYLNRPNPTQDPLLTLQPQDSDELELLLVLPNEDPIRYRVSGVTRGMVIEARQALNREVTAPARFRSNRYLAPAQQLYQWLIAPLEAELAAEDVGSLAFVLDAGVRSLPMSVLHDGEQFLIERYNIGLLPSLSLTDTRYRDLRGIPILAMGASEFDALLPLPAVPTELDAVTAVVPNSVTYLNQSFTEANLLKSRDERPYGIVHLATHAEFLPGDVQNSYIQFGDRRLPLNALRELNLNDPPVELLVLSACRTALGDEQAELGFGGLAVQAGVRSVLASLWYVSDTGTLAFMSEFYRQLQAEPTRSEALRQTQLAMLRGEIQLENDQLITTRGATVPIPADIIDPSLDLTHPYFWASFTMIGSPW